MTRRVAGLATAHLVLAATLVSATPPGGAGSATLAELVGFSAAFALVGLLPLQLGLRRGAGSVTLVEAVLVTAVFTLPPVAVVTTAAVGEALAAATWGTRPPGVAWAAARSAGAAAVAGTAFAALDPAGPLDAGSWVAAAAAAGAFASVTFASNAAAASASGRLSVDEFVRRAVTTVGVAAGIATATGLAAVVLSEAHPLAPVLLSPMAAVVVAGSRRQVHTRAALRHQLDLNDEKSEFVAAVSHDLRTPLTAALASIDTIQRLSGDLAPDMTAELLERAGEHGRRLQRLVEQLLLVAAAEHGTVEVAEEPVDLDELADRAAADLSRATGRRVVVAARSGAGPVLADADKVWRIVVNLVENAAKYAPTGPVELVVAAGDGTIDLAVADRGPGVPEAQRARIFDRFVHIDPAAGGRVDGTGLGLYLGRRLAEVMGGSLDVEDRGGGGAVFCLRLPRRPPAALPTPTRPRSAPRPLTALA